MRVDNVKIILPPHIEPDEFRDVLNKSLALPEDHNLSFEDPVITDLAKKMVSFYSEMYAELISEVEMLLDEDYGGV